MWISIILKRQKFETLIWNHGQWKLWFSDINWEKDKCNIWNLGVFLFENSSIHSTFGGTPKPLKPDVFSFSYSRNVDFLFFIAMKYFCICRFKHLCFHIHSEIGTCSYNFFSQWPPLYTMFFRLFRRWKGFDAFLGLASLSDITGGNTTSKL